jgi:hypothetical protein
MASGEDCRGGGWLEDLLYVIRCYSRLLSDIGEKLLPGGKFFPLRPTKSTIYMRAATALQPRRRRTAMLE